MSEPTKKYLDYEGLKTYNNQIKNWTISQIEEKIRIAVQNLMHIRSTISKAEDIPLRPEVGDVYISTAYFDYYESPVEPGDLFVYTSIGWTIVQGNIDLNLIENMIPTKTSDLDNDTGYITDSDLDAIDDEDINSLFRV